MAYSAQDSGVLINTGLAGVDWGLVSVVMVSAGVCRENRHFKRPLQGQSLAFDLKPYLSFKDRLAGLFTVFLIH